MLVHHHDTRGDALTAFADALETTTTEHPVVFLAYDDNHLASDIHRENRHMLGRHLELDSYIQTFFGDPRGRNIARIGIAADGLPTNGAITLDVTVDQAEFLFDNPDETLVYGNAFKASHGFALLAGLWHHWAHDEFEVDVLHDATKNEAWLSNYTDSTAIAWDAFYEETPNADMRGWRISREDGRLTCQALHYDKTKPMHARVMYADEVATDERGTSQ